MLRWRSLMALASTLAAPLTFNMAALSSDFSIGIGAFRPTTSPIAYYRQKMGMLTLPPPLPEEAAPVYGPYLAMFPDGRVEVHLQAQASELEAVYAGLSEAGAMFRYAEGKW